MPLVDQAGDERVHDRVESHSIIDSEHLHGVDTRGAAMRMRRSPSEIRRGKKKCDTFFTNQR